MGDQDQKSSEANMRRKKYRATGSRWSSGEPKVGADLLETSTADLVAGHGAVNGEPKLGAMIGVVDVGQLMH
jgi:hypothetical protein